MVLTQNPNASLVGMVAGAVLYRLTPPGTPLHHLGYALYVIAGVIWSYEEIVHGVNWFRRLLGVVVLAFVAASLLR